MTNVSGLSAAMSRPESHTRKWMFLVGGIGMLLPGLIWWIAFWPATMSRDSLTTWAAVVEGQPLEVMPVAYWALVFLASLGGRALAVVTLTQVVALTIALYSLSRAVGLTSRRSAVVSGVVMLTPFGGLFAVTLWKDVPTAILMLFGASFLAKSMRSRSFSRESVYGFVLIFVAGLLRFEAPLVIGTIGVVMLSFALLAESGSRRVLARSAGLLIGVGFAAILVASSLQSLAASRGLPSWNKWIPAIADLAYVAATDPNASGPGVDAAREMVTGAALDYAADCQNHSRIFYDEGFKTQAVVRLEDRLPFLWFDALVTNPFPIVEAHICRGAPYLPPPLASSAGPHNWVITTIEQPNPSGLSLAAPVMVRQPLVAWAALWTARSGFLAWPGLLGLVGTLSLIAIGRWKRDRSPRLVLAAVMWGTLLPFAGWTVLTDFRYAAVAQLIGVVAFVSYLGLLAFPESVSDPESERRSAASTNSP